MGESNYESVELFKSSGNKTSMLLKKGAPLPVGGKEGLKLGSQIHITGLEGRTRDIPTVSKEYPLEDREKVFKIVETIDILRKKGYPVPSFARYYEEDSHVCLLLPDLRRGGTHRIWGRSGGGEKEDMSLDQHNTLEEMNLGDDEIGSIKNQVFKIAKKASEDGYDFGWMDKYHLDQDIKTREVEVILLDVDPGMLLPPEKGNFDYGDVNKVIAQAWVNDLKESTVRNRTAVRN